MRYWWVNHNKTSKYELADGYLWSPRKEANGARSQFYENMRLARPGDLVLSFAGGVVGNYGIVRKACSPALKPDSFGKAGEYWSQDGWLLPVDWHEMTPSFQPKSQMEKLRPLLPRKYSPIIKKSGRGNQKAYLAEIDQPIFDLATRQTRIRTSNVGPLRHSEDPALEQLDAAAERLIANDPDLDVTTKEQLIRARRGQGRFRKAIREIEKGCRLTGITDIRYLIASHIKPWRVCLEARERLDGQNGLLMAPHVDFLFDRGFITFADNGRVRVSEQLSDCDLARFGLAEASRRAGPPFQGRQTAYLAYHRENVFFE